MNDDPIKNGDKDTHAPGECCPECKETVEKDRQELLDTAEELLRKLSGHFQNYASTRGDRPLSQRPRMGTTVNRLNDHHIDFECSGEEGQVVDVENVSEHLFRGEKLLAIDDYVGKETVVMDFVIGDKSQYEIFHRNKDFKGHLTEQYAPNGLGCGIQYDIAQPGANIRFRIKFNKAGKWRATLVGKKAVR